MKSTRPLGWLFNFFARQPQGVPFEVLESVQPVVDTAIDYPIELTDQTVLTVFGVGLNVVPIATPAGRHRVYIGGVWYNDTAGNYTPAALQSVQYAISLPNGQVHPFGWQRMDVATGFGVNDHIPFIGKNQFMMGRNASGTNGFWGNMGNVYAPPGSSLVLTWSGGVVSNNTIQVLFVEKDASTPLPFLT